MAISTTLTTADLSTITAFAGLPADTLAWLIAHGEGRTYAAGETIFEPGAPAEFMTAVVQGGIQFYAVKGAQHDPIFRIDTAQVSGVLPYSRLRIIAGQGVAAGETVLYLLHRDHFPALEQTSPELVQRLVGIMNDRSRDQVRGQERDDKLRALGKLSAGLAHELNNPAAAIARAAQALANRVGAKPALFVELVSHCPSPEAMLALTGLAVPSAEAQPPQSALARADREDELADWLASHNVPNGYHLAPALLEAGVTPAALATVADLLPPAARPAAFAWLEGQLTTMQLVHDVQEAGSRISKLVADVKTYSHMDRASGFEPIDVTAGLESTLNILGFQLRQKNIRVVRDFASGLPSIRGQVSSLNQVWTNLLDNAIDALPAQGGEITIRTQQEGGFVRVFLIDNGTGIPAEVLPHIFEPFFTTKQAGDGSGLGLDIAQQIIRQHNGRLEVHSEPGRTEFCAWLPVAN
ncbi:GHKL domain-containing protein [Microvirga sp. STS02]|uniref:ATP-binding protein n=1 Tax=Hymenobacter negativus TaxID=2795026 RepID=UPI0018DC628E|nr:MULTISPECIES: ATP-binding protein [Bacteria]MBH8570298.1 GHKL domain-containing protein [Hymenobacter negativus]MBR7210037.1 GHKL domain-containing protein [Microvirga sp. STS02]